MFQGEFKFLHSFRAGTFGMFETGYRFLSLMCHWSRVCRVYIARSLASGFCITALQAFAISSLFASSGY